MNADTIVYEKKNNLVRLAVLENGQMVEFDMYDKSLAVEGNIYLGRLTHKMELAGGGVGFKVNIGDVTEGFLNTNTSDTKDLSLSEGQSVVVQVAQTRHADKGAKLTRNVQIVGTTVVYRPMRTDVNVSQKITDHETIRKMRSIIFHHMKGQEGWSVRTAAVEFEEDVIVEEMQKLRSVYEAIRMRARSASAPALLYEGEDPLYEYIRHHKSSLKKIVINDHNMVSDVEEVVDTATEYTAEPFEKFGLEDQLIEALNPVAKLKSGGEIIIRQTPACVTIDVDSSALRENGSAADLNNEAAVEIARQIRLKNLAGKIVVDFAGSKEYALMRPVIDLLETELADDASCGKVLGLTKAGNIELVRQRRRPSLLEMYTEECPTCQGTGRVEK